MPFCFCGRPHFCTLRKTCPSTRKSKSSCASAFEIGFATKVFTALLLADAIERGEMKLDDPISKYLPPAVVVPTRNGRQITLLDLATHTSGLPRMPDNFTPTSPTSDAISF
ncbi:MAG: serine hydrolase [Kiritimatiellae bacterium]|nr:serine hydrolase [Kiritimatiellia bacterium]